MSNQSKTALPSSPFVSSSPLMRRREVEAYIGVRTSTLYAMIRSGAFPKPIRANPHAGRTGVVVWSRAVVESWLAQRMRPQVAELEGGAS